ncbi:MAG: chorismate mutase [Chloroflexi bacterium]|nr:chorismate mutase [Chloroflexota bacterium]|tara:strand:- start:238 stop:618 length:381 start_codon:yes stop_codon:yes gene_type:complete
MTNFIRGVKGATTSNSNSSEDILKATEELMIKLINSNGIKEKDVAAVQFTTTKDLNSEFPAVAAREKIQWINVPLMCSHEFDKPGALQKCIRILILWNTAKLQEEIIHLYIKKAKILRPDISNKNK